jgi:cell division septal protein FtsQ
MSNAVFTPPRSHRLLSPRRWRLWVILADVLIFAGIWSIQHWPVLKLQDVIVDGPMAWQSVARDLVTVAPDSNLLSIDRDALERRLALEFGSRAQCRTRLQLPGTLSIRLTPVPLVLWTEGRAGVSVNGNVVVRPVAANDAPVWRTPLQTKSRSHGFRAFEAAAAWADVLESDERWGSVVSELTCDREHGWILTAADGKTRIVLGWSDLESRAADVAHLLSQPDSLLAKPCTIDARFDRRLIVRARSDGERLM